MEAGPWLLSGVKAEPVQVAEPPWKGLLGDGNSWTSPRHCWKGQQMEAASGQILTWPFLPAVLQSTGSQVGLPFPWLPCLWWARVQKTSLSSSTHPPSAAQPCPCPETPSCGLRHFMPYRNALSGHGTMSQPSIKMMGTQAIISQSLFDLLQISW